MIDFDGSKELMYENFPNEFQIRQNGKTYPYYKLANNKIRFMDEVPQAGALDIVEIIQKQNAMKPTLCHTIADLAFMTKDDVERIDDTASRLKVQNDQIQQTLKVSQDLMQDITAYENKNKADIDFLKEDTANGLIGLAKGLEDTNAKLESINTRTISDAESLGAKISDHERANNPHKITKRTIGLEKVDNTADVDKPISKAVQKELDKKADKKALADIEKKLEKTGKKQEEIINGLSSFGAAAAQSQGGGASSFSELEGSPYDNTALNNALNSKQNKIADLNTIRSGAAAGATSVQSITTGTSNGTINVDDTEVSVAGLGSAAYTASSDYATAAQGTLADSALQATDLKTINSQSLLGSGDITIDSLPDQTGQTGKFLTTDGTDASWIDVPPELPTQTGQSGKFLTTDGTNASWGTIPAVDQVYNPSSTNAQSGVAVASAVSGKQDTLVSGTNIKTVNSTSLLGSGDISIQPSYNSLTKTLEF